MVVSCVYCSYCRTSAIIRRKAYYETVSVSRLVCQQISYQLFSKTSHSIFLNFCTKLEDFIGAPKSYFKNYSFVVIVLFRKGLYKSAFFTSSFKKLAFFVFCLFFVFDVIFIDFKHLYNMRCSMICFHFIKICFRDVLKRKECIQKLKDFFSLRIKSILIHECQHKSTRINTNQHEPDTSQHESIRPRNYHSSFSW